MFKQSVTNLLEVSKDTVDKWIDSFDTVITDCDGVLWDGDKIIEGSRNTIGLLQDLGKQVFFCTNNTTNTQREICAKLNHRGFMITSDSIISTAYSASRYLKSVNFEKRAYVIGKPGIALELAAEDIATMGVGPDEMERGLADYVVERFWQPNDDVGAVIVGFDEHFNYVKILKAKRFLSNPECLFIGLNNEKRFTKIDGVVPGSSTIIRAIEAASHRRAFIIGKPLPVYLDYLFQEGRARSRTLVIGDNCRQDVLLGYNCECQTMLVGTGVDNLAFALECKNSEDLEVRKMAPDVYVPRLSDLMSCIGINPLESEKSSSSND